MSDQQKPQVRSDEPELSDEALERVAGGCDIDSQLQDPWNKVGQQNLPPAYPA